MVEIKQRLDNDDHYVGNKVEYIVLHDTGNRTDSDEGNANYFCTGTRNASAHYFVDDDSITQVVLDKNGSFHCGDGYGKYGIHNKNSIGIEMCRVNNTVTATTEANTIDLVKMLMDKYDVPIERVVRHYDASRKNCPSSFSANNWARWTAFKTKLSTPISQPTPQVKEEVYRVRKTWADIKSQIGAYTVLASAKELVAKNKAYKVFNSNGEVVYQIAIPATTDKEVKRYSEKGKCTITVSGGINFRDKPSTDTGKITGAYSKGDSVNYDLVVITEKYTWISWISASQGVRRYMPIADRKANKRWANCI